MMDMWKKLAMGVDSLGDGGSENVSMDPKRNADPAPMILIVSTFSVIISELFKGVQECGASVGKVDAYVEKENPSVGKTDASVGKGVVLPLKCSIPF